jgi:hypothetical protein
MPPRFGSPITVAIQRLQCEGDILAGVYRLWTDQDGNRFLGVNSMRERSTKKSSHDFS